jgi:GSH-dependent disulfide-bond oxidoreductase
LTKLYYFPSPNPQKVMFALLELGLEFEPIPVDLMKREQREAWFLEINPCGRVPVLTDGDVTLWESHAILSYLGDKTGRLWRTTPAGRADALRWLFFLSGHVSPPGTELAFNRIAVKFTGGQPDEAAIARAEKALPEVMRVLDGQLGKGEWMLGDEFTLVECAYGPVLNVIEKAGFRYRDFPNLGRYLAAIRSRPAWYEVRKLPGL